MLTTVDRQILRTPSFFKPAVNDELLATHYLRVADAARIPVLLYAVPIYTHITIEASLVARVAQHPNIAGIKDSSGNVEAVRQIVAAMPADERTTLERALRQRAIERFDPAETTARLLDVYEAVARPAGRRA